VCGGPFGRRGDRCLDTENKIHLPDRKQKLVSILETLPQMEEIDMGVGSRRIREKRKMKA
jgi:hypothetical protein